MESILQFKKSQILHIFKLTHKIVNNKIPYIDSLKGKILCNAFFEPSTRTSMSFEAAMLSLGGNVINFDTLSSSLKKGETFEDTIKTIQAFCDVIVLRHPENEKIYQAGKISNIPIINGGNGDGEHPTQALLDLYTIQENVDITKVFNICFIGDIRYSRTIHSLIHLIAKMTIECNIIFCCYPNCEPPEDYINEISKLFKNCNISFISDLNNSIKTFDVIYHTRYQCERHSKEKYDINHYQINKINIKNMKESAIILHPLPRGNEITYDIDNYYRAKYFNQVKNGLYIRMALLYSIFNDNKDLL